jgi:hypothetical protein
MYYGDYLPTYYGDVLHWEDAMALEVPPGTEAAHIHLVELVNAPEGPGQISGTVSNDFRTGEVPVVLRTQDHTAVMMTNTTAEGAYSFTNLAYGTYEIFAELPGKSITPAIISLNEAHPAVEGIDMVIMENEIVFTLDIFESEIFEKVPFIYPNPAKESASLQLDLKQPTPVRVRIYDQAGKKVTDSQYAADDHDVLHLDLSTYDKGIYIVKIEAMQEQIIRRFVKL